MRKYTILLYEYIIDTGKPACNKVRASFCSH